MRTGPKFRWKFYMGRPVKSMRQVPGGLKLIFVSRVSGEDGEQLVIQQEDWDKHGERREVDSTRMDDIRKLVPVG